MDRRQIKTRDAIFKALSSLLEKKRYENITVQEIIDAANIGRSTFYAHFETKDELLRSMCTDIFHHIFNEDLTQEADHDYSAGSGSVDLKLTHLLYHLKAHRNDLNGILHGESGDLFMKYFREYLNELFSGTGTISRLTFPPATSCATWSGASPKRSNGGWPKIRDTRRRKSLDST